MQDHWVATPDTQYCREMHKNVGLNSAAGSYFNLGKRGNCNAEPGNEKDAQVILVCEQMTKWSVMLKTKKEWACTSHLISLVYMDLKAHCVTF